jgi:hypothetical protein
VANHAQHPFDVFPNVAVPKPQHTISISIEICVTLEIALELRSLTVLPTVNFDHQFRRVAGKVGEVRSNCRLTPKV